MKWREMETEHQRYNYKFWRGRKKNWVVNIQAIYKDMLGRTEVDGYYFLAENGKLDRTYNSLWGEMHYPTLEECQMAAEQWVTHRVAIE